MLPRINFAELTDRVEGSHYFVQTLEKPANDKSKFPAIPPKSSSLDKTTPQDPDEKETWYAVMSPRETRGTSGPFSIPQLRQMYKSGEVKNTTLFWTEGEQDWQQLMYQRTLKPKLLQLPILPPKVGTYNAELAIYDPIVQAPPTDMIEKAELLTGFDITKCCFKCGSMAIAHIPSALDQTPKPDLFKGREEGGTTENTAEVLPGFLWVGAASAAKQRNVLRLGVTMLFNCTSNMKGPNSQPPAFRCREAPMKDQPKGSFTELEMTEILDLLERVYDQVEAHRLTPELTAKSDPTPKEYRGPTDKLGIPIKTAADLKVLRRPQEGEKPLFEPRVLFWSRLGTDRPCMLAAAYIIKQYSITVDHAVHIVKANRTNCAISRPYREVLDAWSRRYTLGLLICIDCQANVDETGKTMGDTAFDAELRAREKAVAKSRGYKKNANIQEADDSSSDDDIGFEHEDDEERELRLNTIDEHGDHRALHEHSSLLEHSVSSSMLNQQRNEHELALENVFSSFVQLMKGNMARMLKDKPHEIAILSKVETYLHKVYTNSVGIRDRVQYFRWNGLMDLELSGRHLSDVTMAVLFQLLAGNELIRQIRMLKLQSNLIAFAALKAMLIAYFPHGHTADDNYFFDDSQSVADVDNSFDLMLLDLSNNKIDEYGMPFLTFFLKQCNTLTSLDVSNNNLGDFLCSDVLQCLVRPPIDFDEDDDAGYGQPSICDRMKPHNYSITTLNIGFNEMSDNGVEMLVNMLKNNAVLRTLNVDLCPKITPAHYKSIATAIRLYNSVIEEISVADNPISVKSMEHLARVFDSRETRICKLNMSNCTMKYQHMMALGKYVLSAQHLTELDLSGNPIGDKGCDALATMITGEKSKLTSVLQPPLKRLDLSSCSFTAEGTAQIIVAIAARGQMERVDISNNVIGPDNLPAYAALARCLVQDLRLNTCKLCSKGASILFKTLADPVTPLAGALRFCYLSGNEISDSAAEALCTVLERNTTLEAVDLGFNLLTDRHGALLRKAGSVLSQSNTLKKLTDLSINLVGNKCDAYMLETPGMSRAKSNFLFGVQPNSSDPANHGYSHIPHCSRGHFMARKELDNQYRSFVPLKALNTIG